MSGNRFGPGTRTINPLGAWLDDQSADSIPPLLRAIVAHQSAGLLRRTSRRGNSRSRRRRSSQSWRSSGRSRGRTGAAGLAGDVSSCSRSDAYFFWAAPRPRLLGHRVLGNARWVVGPVARGRPIIAAPATSTILAFSRRVFSPFGLRAPRAGQPIFLFRVSPAWRAHFLLIGGSSPEHGRHPSSGIEWCAFGGIRPVS